MSSHAKQRHDTLLLSPRSLPSRSTTTTPTSGKPAGGKPAAAKLAPEQVQAEVDADKVGKAFEREVCGEEGGRRVFEIG